MPIYFLRAMSDYLKHLLVRTPFEKPALALQHLLGFRHVLRHPGLFRVQEEPIAVRAAIRRLINRRDMNCIDVGAHVGSVLSLVIECTPRGLHMAFEPSPEKAQWLRKKFPEVEVHSKALAAEPGRASFSINETRSGFSGLLRYGDVSDSYSTVEVEVARLDDVVPPERKIGLLKIVVEGAEFSVLQGAVRILRDSQPALIFESSAAALNLWGISPRRVYEFIANQGYELRTPHGFLRNARSLSFDEYLLAQQYPFQAFRFVATPRETA